MEIGEMDPFESAITVASACNQFFRLHHLKKDTIGIVPHGGYRRSENQSVLALKWLKWTAETTGQRIRHKLNGGEVKVGTFRVDGISGNTIFEVYGCAYHGCVRCYKRRQQLTPGGSMTMAEAYQRTMDRRAFLLSQGYVVVEKWEHEIRSELKTNPEMAAFFDKVTIMDALDPREAFYGGRTNATVLHYEVIIIDTLDRARCDFIINVRVCISRRRKMNG